jgi:hypothetical protein
MINELDTPKSRKDETGARERGVALLWVAGMLVALLGVSAFAVDLGWLYLNTARLQKAADAAALAGVVNLPALPAQADLEAQSAASANKFPIGNPVSNTFSSQVLTENQYEVTLGTEVGTFFLKVLGINSFAITRVATAQYIQPVPMGSPANCFGVGNTDILNHLFNGSSGPAAAKNRCDNYTQNFWAAINGPQTAREHGDPYMVACLTSSGGSCSGGANPWFDTANHYYYGIDVPAGKTFLDVWLYDAGFYDRNDLNLETGDSELGSSSPNGADMTYTLYRADATPHDPTDNTAVCTLSIASEFDPATYMNQWRRLCRANNPLVGMWVLKVTSNGNDGGTNQYALLVNTNNFNIGPPAKIFAINDMGIFTNDVDGNATVWLAEVLPVHAGKKLELRFFDPGESAPPATMTVQNPSGATATSCSWTADNGSSGSSCAITTANGSGSLFNGRWITLLINIPSNYTCDPAAAGNSGCYWKMNLDLNTSHDRTTWSARVIGNPIRLVPNG